MPHPSSPPQDPPRARLASLSHPRTLALIAIALAIGLLLRVPGMLQSLWLDEIFRTRLGLATDRLWWLLFYDVHNPLYNALIWVWIRVAGDSEIAIRLPSLFVAIALIALIWRWAAARFGVLAGSVAGLWLLVSPVAVWYSTEAKNNIFTVLFATAGVCLIDVAMRSRRTRDVALAAAACVLAVATDFQSLLVLAPAWIAVAWFGVAGAYGSSDPGKPRAAPSRLTPLIIIAPLALALVSTILIRTTQSERETVITPNPDWRGLAEWNREGTEVPIIANTMVLPLEYYAPGLRAFQVQGADDRVARIHAIVRDERLEEFIFAHNPHWYSPMTDEEIAQALSVGEVVGRAHFQSFDAWRVRVRDVVITPSPSPRPDQRAIA
jgi:uncharacterized membrane protein